jgi:transcriptional regulator with XRE-family HTH domain
VTDAERKEARANLGPWLRGLRDKTGQSQDALAQALGTDRRKIIRWEKGESEPEGLALLAYLDAVGVQLTPAPPASIPRAVNAELRALRAEIAALRGLLLESIPKTRRGSEAYFREFQQLLRERNELMAEQPDEGERQLQKTG